MCHAVQYGGIHKDKADPKLINIGVKAAKGGHFLVKLIRVVVVAMGEQFILKSISVVVICQW